MGADNALPQTLSGIVVVLLVDLLKAKRSWGWLRLAQGSLALKHVAGFFLERFSLETAEFAKEKERLQAGQIFVKIRVFGEETDAFAAFHLL